VNLLFAPLIAPDYGGPDNSIIRIQQDRTVHLPGESDARDCVFADASLPQGVAHSRAARIPPVLRILLGPARFGTGKRPVLRGGRGNYLARSVNDDRAGPTGSDIDSKEFDTSLP
jgi:hypothetical protein